MSLLHTYVRSVRVMSEVVTQLEVFKKEFFFFQKIIKNVQGNSNSNEEARRQSGKLGAIMGKHAVHLHVL